MSKHRVIIPGMRNLKTALAVFLSLLVCMTLKTHYPFYAAITTVIVIQSDISSTVKIGFNRLFGTFVGGIVGGSFLQLFEHISTSNILQYYIMVGVCICLLIYLLTLIKWPGAVAVCCVVFLGIVVTQNTNNLPPYLFALYRVLDTSVGIVVGTLVNWVLPFEQQEKKGRREIVLFQNRKPHSPLLQESKPQNEKPISQEKTSNKKQKGVRPRKIERPTRDDKRAFIKTKKFIHMQKDEI